MGERVDSKGVYQPETTKCIKVNNVWKGLILSYSKYQTILYANFLHFGISDISSASPNI